MTWHLGERVQADFLGLWATAEITGFTDPHPRVKVRILDTRNCYRGTTGGIITVPYTAIRRPQERRRAAVLPAQGDPQ